MEYKMDKKEVVSRLQEILNRNNDRKVNKLMPEDIRQLNICIAALTMPVVSASLLADFLKYAIDETMRISGDYDGIAGTLYVDDTYEKIAGDYISICNER